MKKPSVYFEWLIIRADEIPVEESGVWEVRLWLMIISYGRFKGTTFLRNVENVYPTSKSNIPKEFNLQQHRGENLKSRSDVLFCLSAILCRVWKRERTTKQDTERKQRVTSCGIRVSFVSIETIVLFIAVGVDVTVSNTKRTLFPWKLYFFLLLLE
jgi:hypothetical protein